MSDPTNLPLIAQGKTKNIYLDIKRGRVLIHSKDDITAGDGARRDVIKGKGIHANTTTCNCFRLLNAHQLRTHFICYDNVRTFCAYSAQMIPLELVARRIATGSFLKRRPDVSEGTRFHPLVIEFFEKDDANHDPLVIFDQIGSRVLRYKAKQPLATGFMSEEPFAGSRFSEIIGYLDGLHMFITQAFHILERAWQKQDVTLVDLKIECGLFAIGGNPALGIADVIDNDSWRIWPGGEKARMLDKQVYRDATAITDDRLREILANYAAVATATDKFLVQS